MSTKLSYPKLPDGYRWNLLNKIRMATGYWPGTWTTGTNTYLEFHEDLNQSEIDTVDAIMASPESACDPVEFAITGNTYIVKDIWNYRAQIEAACGFNVAIGYKASETPPDPGALDLIVLQPTDPTYQAVKILTNPEKNALENAIIALGGWQ
jgi:hypothetical protein